MFAHRRVDDRAGQIPAEAPRAPTQEEWDAMNPTQRQRVMDELASSESQEPLDQADAMAEGDEHYDAKEEVRSTLRHHFERLGKQVYVGAERGVFYPGHKGFTPDIIAVADVSPHKRDTWMVSQEGRGVDVIIEVFHKGSWKKGYPSEKLDLDLGIRRGRLRFFLGSSMVPTSSEVIAELEELAEQEQARAEQEQARAEQSLLQLRETLLSLLSSRGLAPTEALSAEVHACADPLQLRRWFDRALRAQQLSDVFQDS